MRTVSFLFRLVSGIFLLCTTGFSQEKQADAYREINDIPYYPKQLESSDKQKLNLVLPKGKANAPMLIWIGGGAWSYVDRNQEMDVARKVAKKGIAVASIGHRLSPAPWKDPSYTTGIQHPEHIKDLAMAFKWIYEHAAEYGYAQKNIFVGGFSSGGHLAALLTTDERYLKQLGLSVSLLKGVIPIAGAYEIPGYYQILSDANGKELADSHVKGVFGPTKKEWLDASPTTYVQGMQLPMLLISEANTYRYTSVFEDKIRKSGFKKLEVFHFHEMNHGGLWKHISFEKQSKYRDVIVTFIKQQAAI